MTDKRCNKKFTIVIYDSTIPFLRGQKSSDRNSQRIVRRVERRRNSTKSNVLIRGRRDSRVASVTGWKATSLLLLINVNAARFDGGASSRKTRRRAANQTVRNGAKVQFGLLVGSSVSGGHAIGRLFARESILRFRGMPRLCNEGEEQRTSGAEWLRLDGYAWCYRVIGPGWNSGSSNVTTKDKPSSDARCTPGSHRLLIRRKQIPPTGTSFFFF